MAKIFCDFSLKALLYFALSFIGMLHSVTSFAQLPIHDKDSPYYGMQEQEYISVVNLLKDLGYKDSYLKRKSWLTKRNNVEYMPTANGSEFIIKDKKSIWLTDPNPRDRIVMLDKDKYIKALFISNRNPDKAITISGFSRLKYIELTISDEIDKPITLTDLPEFEELKVDTYGSGKLQVGIKLGNLPKIRVINGPYYKDRVDFIPISNLPSLEVLSIPRSKVKQLDLTKMPNLRYFDVSGCKNLTDFDLNNIPFLEDFRFGGYFKSPIGSLDKIKGLKNLKYLRKVWLMGFEGFDDLSFMVKNKGLIDLELTDRVGDLDTTTIAKLTQLQHLKFFRAGNLSNLNFLKDLQQLITLTVHSKIKTTQGIGNKPKLEYLDMGGSTIDVTEGFEGLPKLNEIRFGVSKLKNMQGLNALSNVKKAYFDGANLYNRIDGFENMTQLEELNMSRTGISSIRGLDNLKSLKKLLLDNNNIRKIKGLHNLESLDLLDLGYNRISRIEGLHGLKKLRGLILRENRIKKIEGLESLENLVYLNVSGNNISKIENVQHLKKLANINPYRNPLVNKDEFFKSKFFVDTVLKNTNKEDDSGDAESGKNNKAKPKTKYELLTQEYQEWVERGKRNKADYEKRKAQVH